MIGYYTDNNISQGVMEAFRLAGVRIDHIKNFYDNKGAESIFYGILRGSGMAMRWCKAQKIDYWYVDNGYFGAHYMDHNKRKVMDGKYRIVKNDMSEAYTGIPWVIQERRPLKILALPPSPYTAFMYDTTPEDWLINYARPCMAAGDEVRVRDKDDKTPFSEVVKDFDAVLAFNSMAVMDAIKMGKAAYGTHGVIRNAATLLSEIPYYNYDDMIEFYDDKNFTLDEIATWGLKCLKN